jgi:hypothetical protein
MGMPPMRAILVLCLSVIALPGAAQPAASGRWVTLTNEAGARVEYPPALFRDERSSASNRQSFTTEDGRGRFEFFSIPNTHRETPGQFVRRAERKGERLTYNRVTGKFVAASTIREGRILYRRCNFNGDMIHCIDLRYPAGQKRAWDGVVTRISLSLRPL